MTTETLAGQRAIEDGFPFEALASIAELESWRKEINRPIYHIHKWWAQRLGSVFRMVLIAAALPKGADVMRLFYESVSLQGLTVFDPFMGSGTTVGEAHKLGARSIGKDINPVAVFAVQNALGEWSRNEVMNTFKSTRDDLAETLRSYYVARLPNGATCEVLYYFWVKTISCPDCGETVDLFHSRIFSKHASPLEHPEARALCPVCNAINTVNYDANSATCRDCGKTYDPQTGNTKGANAICPTCKSTFPIAKTYLETKKPPSHRLYAKMVLTPEGLKLYLPADDFDRQLYQKASLELMTSGQCYPLEAIESGYNTDQVLNYGYTHWHQMFNNRQLLCLSLLSQRIAAISVPRMRNLFTCLFSGVLEFNNMFASFKGEGTGAVRHMFSHHILKPELTPLEANLWGTSKSSGAFSTLFESRILRALDYRERPFELQVGNINGKAVGRKVFNLSRKVGDNIATTWGEFESNNAHILITCGDSSKTDIPDETVDLVVTDPPFFDNVHYSQLADFFYVWLRHILGPYGMFAKTTTRAKEEVQQTDPHDFCKNLTSVFRECARVLKNEGLLIFTYHHSRADGWDSVLRATLESGFVITHAHPTKSEMSVAQPKRQAKEPINIDIVLVCRKGQCRKADSYSFTPILETAYGVAYEQISRFNASGYKLSRNDVLVVLMGQVLVVASRMPDLEAAVASVSKLAAQVSYAVELLWSSQERTHIRRPEENLQTSLFASHTRF